MARMPERCLSVSEFNRRNLLEAGFICPILISFKDYAKTPSQDVLKHYQDGKTNLIFVGHIALQKHQEDVIRAFSGTKSI